MPQWFYSQIPPKLCIPQLHHKSSNVYSDGYLNKILRVLNESSVLRVRHVLSSTARVFSPMLNRDLNIWKLIWIIRWTIIALKSFPLDSRIRRDIGLESSTGYESTFPTDTNSGINSLESGARNEWQLTGSGLWSSALLPSKQQNRIQLVGSRRQTSVGTDSDGPINWRSIDHLVI